MKDRGELGCALLLIVALVAGVIFVLSQAPWLLIAGPLVLVAGIIALFVLADVTSDEVLMASDEPGGFTAWRIQILNRLRHAINKSPLWQVPNTGVTFDERQLVKQAARLSADIAAALRTSAAPVSDRALIQQQADDVPGNMAKALWRLSRLRRVERSIDLRTPEGQRSRNEMAGVEQQIVAEMQRALSTLSAVPVNLIKVEVAQADRPGTRLLSELNETNQQLRDLSAAYDEMHGKQAGR